MVGLPARRNGMQNHLNLTLGLICMVLESLRCSKSGFEDEGGEVDHP
jgi:hypothetical protein